MKDHLSTAKGRLRPFRSVSLRLSTGDETIVAPALERLSTQFEGSVGIGSYPVCQKPLSESDSVGACARGVLVSIAWAGTEALVVCSDAQSSSCLTFGASMPRCAIGHEVRRALRRAAPAARLKLTLGMCVGRRPHRWHKHHPVLGKQELSATGSCTGCARYRPPSWYHPRRAAEQCHTVDVRAMLMIGVCCMP